MHQRDLVPSPSRAVEGVPDHPLHTVGGVHADFGGDFGWGTGADHTTIPDIETLGSLTDNDKVDLLSGDDLVGERRRDAGKQPAWPEVDVMVEGEPQPQQQASLQQPAGHIPSTGSCTDRAQQDGVRLGELGQHRFGKDLARTLPARCTEVVVGGRNCARPGHRRQNLETFRHHLGADAVTADDGEFDRRRTCIRTSDSCGLGGLRHRRIVATGPRGLVGYLIRSAASSVATS